jgi:hypothetical protein
MSYSKRIAVRNSSIVFKYKSYKKLKGNTTTSSTSLSSSAFIFVLYLASNSCLFLEPLAFEPLCLSFPYLSASGLYHSWRSRETKNEIGDKTCMDYTYSAQYSLSPSRPLPLSCQTLVLTPPQSPPL